MIEMESIWYNVRVIEMKLKAFLVSYDGMVWQIVRGNCLATGIWLFLRSNNHQFCMIVTVWRSEEVQFGYCALVWAWLVPVWFSLNHRLLHDTHFILICFGEHFCNYFKVIRFWQSRYHVQFLTSFVKINLNSCDWILGWSFLQN